MMCSHVMSVICCEVMRCNGMPSHEFVMRCGPAAISRCEVRSGCVMRLLEDELGIRSTKYCKY